VSIDEQHVAFPKLRGAPAYARPPVPVPVTPRPLDPDELPLLAEQTPEERALMEALLGRNGQAWPGRSPGTAPGPVPTQSGSASSTQLAAAVPGAVRAVPGEAVPREPVPGAAVPGAVVPGAWVPPRPLPLGGTTTPAGESVATRSSSGERPLTIGGLLQRLRRR
jgi:hypothetical protein